MQSLVVALCLLVPAQGSDALKDRVGQGGWTWYTGSAGWMYQLIIEWLLGIQLEDGNKLRFVPCIPREWNHLT